MAMGMMPLALQCFLLVIEAMIAYSITMAMEPLFGVLHGITISTHGKCIYIAIMIMRIWITTAIITMHSRSVVLRTRSTSVRNAGNRFDAKILSVFLGGVPNMC